MRKLKGNTSLSEKAITLIALVVTIVILLILAGVTITMTLGQNGLFTRAKEGRSAYEESDVKDDFGMLITQYTWDKSSEKTDKSLGDYLKDNGATSVKENSDGKTLDVEYKDYIFTVDKESGNMSQVSKKENSGNTQTDPEIVVSDIKVTEDLAGQGNNVDKGTIVADSGKNLYITFASSINGGTTKVNPVLPFEVSKNGSYKFTITGTVGSKTYTKEQTVIVNQYKIKAPQVGDIVSYTPDTPSTGYDLTIAKSGYETNQTIDKTYDPTIWKVMELDESGNITKLFGVGPKNVGFYGSTGYNNGVYLLNDICKSRYGNASLGATARSLKIEDIETRMNATGIATRNAYKSGKTQYGSTKKYTGSYTKYPALYAQEKYSGVNVSDVANNTQVVTGSVNATAQAKMNPNGKDKSDNIYTTLPKTSETTGPSKNSLTCTQTYYQISQDKSYYDDVNFYNMVFGTGTYFWVASRWANCNSDESYAYFGLNIVNGSYLSGAYMFFSNGSDGRTYSSLAPVVTFNSGIQVINGSGTIAKPYEIAK